MQFNDSIERQIQQVYLKNRQACIQALLNFEDIPLDFTQDYLQAFTLEKLQHILIAALVTVSHRQKTIRKAA